MRPFFPLILGMILPSAAFAVAKVESAASADDKSFKLEKIAGPSVNDAAAKALFTLVDGEHSGNGAALDALHDGRVPGGADEPSGNFFFKDGTSGGRIQIDLGKVISLKAVNSYSWHPRDRAAQVYKLYAARGDERGFSAAPKREADPLTCGWKAVAKVDTRGKAEGGQQVVSIADAKAANLGEFRYLLFDIESTDAKNSQSNTFFSEIDVVDANGSAPQPVPEKILKTYAAPAGKYQYVIDSTLAPDLGEWAEKELLPVVYEWYPKLVALLPDEGFRAPEKVTFEFRDDMEGTPAYAGGGRVSLNIPWFHKQLKGEAKGCVIHELVHIVQQYGRGRGKSQAPGWVTEGIPDYIRWFLYEPKSKGAEITVGNFERSSYDASYRTTANFLNWVVETHDKDFIRKLNSAARAGNYSDQVWKDATGKTAAELGAEWKKANAKRLGL